MSSVISGLNGLKSFVLMVFSCLNHLHILGYQWLSMLINGYQWIKTLVFNGFEFSQPPSSPRLSVAGLQRWEHRLARSANYFDARIIYERSLLSRQWTWDENCLLARKWTWDENYLQKLTVGEKLTGCFSSISAMSCPAVMLFNGSDLGYIVNGNLEFGEIAKAESLY